MGRTGFLPPIGGKRIGLNESIIGRSNDESQTGVSTRGVRPDVFLVTIEAYPKMTLSSSGKYLPNIISNFFFILNTFSNKRF